MIKSMAELLAGAHKRRRKIVSGRKKYYISHNWHHLDKSCFNEPINGSVTANGSIVKSMWSQHATPSNHTIMMIMLMMMMIMMIIMIMMMMVVTSTRTKTMTTMKRWRQRHTVNRLFQTHLAFFQTHLANSPSIQTHLAIYDWWIILTYPKHMYCMRLHNFRALHIFNFSFCP